MSGCVLRQKPILKPASEMKSEEYRETYNRVFLECGDGCDCCMFACNGGLGSEEYDEVYRQEHGSRATKGA